MPKKSRLNSENSKFNSVQVVNLVRLVKCKSNHIIAYVLTALAQASSKMKILL